MVRDRNLPKLESLDGLVSLDASLEPAVDRGIPEDIRRGLGDSCSLPRLYMYASRELGDPERLVANAINTLFDILKQFKKYNNLRCDCDTPELLVLVLLLSGDWVAGESMGFLGRAI